MVDVLPPDDEDERTIDADPDLVERVRAAVRASRDGLAAPAPSSSAGGPWSPPAPGGPTSSILPADDPGLPADRAVITPAVEAEPVAPAPAEATGRWQPPARLRPAELRPTAPLVSDPTPARRHLDWRWAVAAVVLAAVIGFLIALAVRGDGSPEPSPGSTTVPGAPTTATPP